MAKKDLNDDLFAGGSISGDEKKSKRAKKSKTPKSPSKKGIASNTIRIIKAVVACVVVVALLVTYVATGAVRKGFIHSTLQWTTNLTAVTVKSDDGEKARIPVSTYNYYFAMTYNNLMQSQSTYEQYGLDLETYNLDVDFDKPLSKQTTTNDDGEVITWLEYINDQVVDSIKSTYTYYLEAVKANGGEEPEITEEQQSELDSTLTEYAETASGYGYTLSGYLVAAMGKGVTESVYRREATRAYIAQNYTDTLNNESSEKEYTDDELNAYKDEHLQDLQSVSVRIFEANTEDDAIAFKNALKGDGSNFTDLAVQYSDEGFDKEYYSDPGASTRLYATRDSFINQGGAYAIAVSDDNHEESDEQSESDKESESDEHSEEEELSYPGLDWLFSADRKAGESYQYSTTVVYIISPVELSDVSTVNVRHILISPITDDDDSTSPQDATDEQWETALSTAQDILNQFNNGDKTEDSFASLATENTTDTGSSSNGGLYENVSPGDMVSTFDSWCFADDRSEGDTAIVRSQYGYHIMYFSGRTGTPVWKYSAENSLSTEDAKTAAEQLEESYKVSVNWFGSRYFEKDVDIDN